MKHQCGTCLREFSDDSSSSEPPERVFCVFCGMRLFPRASALPFGASSSREGTSLGVLGAGGSSFPTTLPQFRVTDAPADEDSIRPVHHEAPSSERRPPAAPRFGKFWTSLAVGFGVGACAAIFLAERGSSTTSVAATRSPRSVPTDTAPPAPAVVSTGCAEPVTTAPAAPSAQPPQAEATPVTPRLERRFWMERARTAQRNFRLAEAQRFYQRVLHRAPKDSEALAGLGEVELLRGQRTAADTLFREALTANEDYVPARVALADSHWQAGQAEEARREYQQIVERYAADSFPPYVPQRLQGNACVPQCEEPARLPQPPTTLGAE